MKKIFAAALIVLFTAAPNTFACDRYGITWVYISSINFQKYNASCKVEIWQMVAYCIPGEIRLAEICVG